MGALPPAGAQPVTPDLDMPVAPPTGGITGRAPDNLYHNTCRDLPPEDGNLNNCCTTCRTIVTMECRTYCWCK